MLSFLPLYHIAVSQVPAGPAYTPGTGDIIISEIMADPVPSAGLPENEFLEITNRTDDTLSTAGMVLLAGSDRAYLLPELIAPGEYVILCSTGSRTKFLPYGRVMAVKSFPSLNNDGEVIAIRDGTGKLIHAVSYSPEFLGGGPRSDGGWSAEMTDIDNPFNEPVVWMASVDPTGGTPGRCNSVSREADDLSCPEVIAVWPRAPDTIIVLFNETVMINEALNWTINGEETMSAVSADIADHSVLIRLHDQLMAETLYDLQIPRSLSDFAGNKTCVTGLKTGIASDLLPGEVLFNEIMFDPTPGCQDYVELYNNSEKIVDLSSLYLAAGTSAVPVKAADVPRQLLPGEYVALTTERGTVADMYSCAASQNIYETSHLPLMPDDKGTLILYDRKLTIIDRFDYSSSMHLLFLSGTEGIALEKVAPDLSSDIKSNWHSASESCGWGSPGLENSTLVTSKVEKRGMTLSSSRLSPDNDGFEDVLSVDVFPGGSGNIISVTVFSDRGYIVRKLAERFAAGEGARFIWDGTSDTGSRLPAGLYMIIADSFNTEGKTHRWKDVCALLYR